ncbi:MAG: phosphopyruvate hydratase [Paracoccaceae bacterium]|nr:phosphopyruvate hydratase [Paracoccaceae bacterium]MDE2918130.1 phosphopyruvate hydratase [Paracoccaceae bacterium]
MTAKIQNISARRIWDSRGFPTVEVEVESSNGILGRGLAPAGASKGKREAIELRDGGQSLQGKDVNRSLQLIASEISPRLIGRNLDEAAEIDRFLIAEDGTKQKSNYGGNTLVAISLALYNGWARSEGIPLWKLFSRITDATPLVPLPEIQIFGGGAHASNRVDIQDFMIMVPKASSFAEALEVTSEIYHSAGSLLKQKGKLAGVADEGGWWPDFDSNEEALAMLVRAMEEVGEKPGERVVISLDIASSEFYRDNMYRLGLEGREYTSEQWIEILGGWLTAYPIVSIEDPMAENDPKGMIEFTRRFGKKYQIVGDDYLVTSEQLVRKSHEEGACNSLLLKVNQVGTVTEAIEAFKIAESFGWSTIVSARSGETEDVTISHLATGLGCGQLKVGSFSRSERMTKWNECLRIEEVLGTGSYAGSLPLLNTWWGI